MSTILAIIICLGVWFFMIAPFIRLWRASKQWRDLYSDLRRGADPRTGHRRQRQAEQPAPKKKKIDPNVGEYVEFTETVSTTETESGDGSTTEIHTETESQITDVTWTDIPEK